MSTKNLASTVIEGGRTSYDRWERRNSNALDRTRERELSTQLVRYTEREAVVYARREPLYRMFSDKLGPAERWLASQVGRPWSKVRSELFERFDARTTAGPLRRRLAHHP